MANNQKDQTDQGPLQKDAVPEDPDVVQALEALVGEGGPDIPNKD